MKVPDLLRRWRRGNVLDVRDVAHTELVAVSLGKDVNASTWLAVAEVEGFVGAMRPPNGEIKALFVRQARSRTIAERDLVIDLRDVAQIDLAATRTR